MELFLVHSFQVLLTAETLIYLPPVIIDRDSSETVRAAVIAHPWSLLGISFKESSNF